MSANLEPRRTRRTHRTRRTRKGPSRSEVVPDAVGCPTRCKPHGMNICFSSCSSCASWRKHCGPRTNDDVRPHLSLRGHLRRGPRQVPRGRARPRTGRGPARTSGRARRRRRGAVDRRGRAGPGRCAARPGADLGHARRRGFLRIRLPGRVSARRRVPRERGRRAGARRVRARAQPVRLLVPAPHQRGQRRSQPEFPRLRDGARAEPAVCRRARLHGARHVAAVRRRPRRGSPHTCRRTASARCSRR